MREVRNCKHWDGPSGYIFLQRLWEWQYAYTGGTHFVATYIGINDEGYLTETPDLSEFTKNGFSMVSIYERSPNSLSYFTGNTNGISNAEYGAKGSIQAAQKAGQKVGTGAIYFTVDYDPPKD